MFIFITSLREVTNHLLPLRMFDSYNQICSIRLKFKNILLTNSVDFPIFEIIPHSHICKTRYFILFFQYLNRKGRHFYRDRTIYSCQNIFFMVRLVLRCSISEVLHFLPIDYGL